MRKTASTENPVTTITGTAAAPRLAWDEERDGSFFAITGRLFPAEFLLGASVLLASYDRAEP